MLVLTRKVGESIIISGGITVTILGIDRGQIKIGTTAPKHVTVNREEIQKKIDAEQKAEKLTKIKEEN